MSQSQPGRSAISSNSFREKLFRLNLLYRLAGVHFNCFDRAQAFVFLFTSRTLIRVVCYSSNYEMDEVLCDGRKLASAAEEYLIGLGHKNPGYVGECHNEARYKGFLDILSKYDIELETDYIIETKQTEVEGFEAMKKLLQMEDCPTGIYCANDITAIGMLKCLNKYKNRYFMPSIISTDDIEEAQYCKPASGAIIIFRIFVHSCRLL